MKKSIVQSESFVSIEVAADIGALIKYPIVGNVNKLTKTKSSNLEQTSKNIESVTEVSDESGIAISYIINYENGGFLVVSADNRLNPILAYSESNSFTVDKSDYPLGLVNWFDNTEKTVKKVRELNPAQRPEIKQEWELLAGIKAPDPEDPPGGGDIDPENCEDVTDATDPLLTTEWHQSLGFNDSVPDKGCGAFGTPAGCVAIAMAQVMNYYEYPTIYNWANMLPAQGTPATATLIRDIGISVGMDYGCEVSLASTSLGATKLKEDYGYYSADYSPYNKSTVRYELSKNRPVILRATDQNNKGHAWVCDGYVNTAYCHSGATYLVFHMNWGQYDGAYNGYFGYTNWDMGDHNFDNEIYMITRIIP